MRAVIMAGGMGTRLAPITSNIPKPMAKILGKSVMEYAIQALVRCSIVDIDVTLCYLPREIMDYFSDGFKWGAKINYHIEDIPLGTAGSVFDAIANKDDDVLILSGDAIFDIDLREFINYYNKKKPLVAMAIKKTEIPTEYGVVVCDEDKITQFLEKPTWSNVSSDDINCGIYILSKDIKKYDSKKRPLDFSKDVFKAMMDNKETINTFSIDKYYWCDIGSPNDYLDANIHYMQNCKMNTARYPMVTNPCYIQDNVKISKKSSIGPNTYIEENCIIGDNCNIKNSIIMENTIIENGVQIDGAIICNNVIIKENCIIESGAILAHNCIINENTILKSNARIWENVNIPTYSVINNKIDTASLKNSINLISDGKISGKIRLDECCVLGYIVGKMAGNKEKVIINHIANDPQALALMSGVLASGASCINIKNMPAFLLSNTIVKQKAKMGIHVCAGVSGNLYILNSLGHKISGVTARKIKDAVKRNTDTNLSDASIGRIINSPFSLNAYSKTIHKALDKYKITPNLLEIKLLGDTSIFENKCFNFMVSYQSNPKPARFTLNITDGGIDFTLNDEFEPLDASSLKEKAAKDYMSEKDAFLKAFIIILNRDSIDIENKKITINKICNCPQEKKGALMKELYKKYASTITPAKEGVSLEYGMSKLHITPHDVAPIVNIVGTSQNRRRLDRETQAFINDMKMSVIDEQTTS